MVTRKILYAVLAACMTVGFSTVAFAGSIRIGNPPGGAGGSNNAGGAVISGTPGKTMTVTTPSGNTCTPGSGVQKTGK